MAKKFVVINLLNNARMDTIVWTCVHLLVAVQGSNAMTTRRKDIVCYEDTPFYHCISNMARGLPLLASESERLKALVEQRLRFLAGIFAIGVCSHSVMDTHFHLLLLIRRELALSWTGREIATRWAKLCPPKDSRRKLLTGEQLQFWIDERSRDEKWVEVHRERLLDLGWFHRFLKQPLSKLINEITGTTGTVFKGRFKSIAVMDGKALLTTNIYVDLNPLAAGLAKTPEQSKFTSLRLRFENALKSWKLDELITSLQTCKPLTGETAEIENLLWLIAIENRSDYSLAQMGMFENITLSQYFLLVDQAARMPRIGKASLSAEALGILERMQIAHESWIRVQQEMATGRFYGNYFAFSRQTLRKVAERLGKRHLVNLNGIEAG